MEGKSLKQKSLFRFTKYILVFIISLLIIVTGLYYSLDKISITKLTTHEKQILASIKDFNQIDNIVSDVLYLAEHYKHIEDELKDHKEVIKHLSHDFLSFSHAKYSYDQIRLIDSLGMETIRINKSSNNHLSIVAIENLQNKSDRYYFTDLIILNENEIYISPLDLNIENDAVEFPYKPMIRVGTPIFNNKGQKTGVIIVNYRGKFMLDKFRELGSNSYGEFYLVNKNGFYLISALKDEEWGFMFEPNSKANFKIQHSAEWQEISNNNSGTLNTKSGLFNYTTLYPLPSNGVHPEVFGANKELLDKNKIYWKVITFIPEHNIQNRLLQIHLSWIFILITISIFIIYLLFLIARNKEQRLESDKIINENYKNIEKQSETINKQKIHLETQNKYLKKRKEELDEVVTTKDKLLSLIAHDIHGFFATIIGFTDLLNSNIDSYSKKKIKKFTEIISKSSTQGQILLQNLIEWSQMQKGLLKYDPKDLYLHEIISDNIDLLLSATEKKNIKIVSKIPKDCIVYAERKSINAVLRNLLSNAVKFSFNDSKIKLTHSIEKGMVIICITDTGKGVSEKDLPKLFSKTGSHSTLGTENEKGSGLGLVMCKEFIELNKGEIWAESSEGKGSRFYFSMPLPE